MSANSPVFKRWFKRSLIAVTILAVGLIVGILVITPPSAETQSAAVVTEVERDTGFDFLDHELRFAGGYALVAPAERDAGFDFVDHELRFAGGVTPWSLQRKGMQALTSWTMNCGSLVVTPSSPRRRGGRTLTSWTMN